MSRHPELETILEAWFELENCAPSKHTAALRRFHDLLDHAIAKANMRGVTRKELQRLLIEPFREFKRSKLREERAKLSRLR